MAPPRRLNRRRTGTSSPAALRSFVRTFRMPPPTAGPTSTAKASMIEVPSGREGRTGMAEAAGDVVRLPTPRGDAEARRMGQAEAGQSRWCVRHPWGTETFYGTAEQV